MAQNAPTPERLFERYRKYLVILARLQMDPCLAPKVDPSDIVQQTLLKAHEAAETFRKLDEAAQLAWLRQVLSYNLADEIRRYNRSEDW
jgi:RNA polymerase sigma-70 factor (ECF subfamily)